MGCRISTDFILFSNIFESEFFLQDKCNTSIIITKAIFILEGKLISGNIVWTNTFYYTGYAEEHVVRCVSCRTFQSFKHASAHTVKLQRENKPYHIPLTLRYNLSGTTEKTLFIKKKITTTTNTYKMNTNLRNIKCGENDIWELRKYGITQGLPISFGHQTLFMRNLQDIDC